MLETGGLGLRSRVIFPDGFLRYGRGRPSPSREDGCCYWPGGGIPNGPGDASCVMTAEPCRAGLPLRSSVLRPTDASPLRVPGTGRRLRIQRSGRCLSWDERRAVSCGCAFAIVCAAADGCIAPTGAGVRGRAAGATGREREVGGTARRGTETRSARPAAEE